MIRILSKRWWWLTILLATAANGSYLNAGQMVGRVVNAQSEQILPA
ncbi:MAG: hypothetical protein M2R45_03396 [Verrucomicrobia subdivision 3 bacterium]|nr:hypothetical protein [Limisphaerales bacterium]